MEAFTVDHLVAGDGIDLKNPGMWVHTQEAGQVMVVPAAITLEEIVPSTSGTLSKQQQGDSLFTGIRVHYVDMLDAPAMKSLPGMQKEHALSLGPRKA